MTINARCNWPHKVNALFAIDVALIRTSLLCRSRSPLLIPRRGIESTRGTPLEFHERRNAFPIAIGESADRLARARASQLYRFPKCARPSLPAGLNAITVLRLT